MIAAGNRHPYHEISLNLTPSGTTAILLAVHDQRTEMISTGKEPEFVGYMRSGFGIPFNIGTKSGQPLAVDLANVIGNALIKKGFAVKNMPTSPSETHEQLVQKMKEAKAGMPVILHLTTWHSDCYQVVWYYYNLVLQVYDTEGKFIGQKMIEGKESVGSSFWNPPKFARKNLPPAMKKRLEELFNSPEIVALIK